MGKTQRNEEHLKFQVSTEANPHPKVKNKEGENITTRKGIANGFEEFYEKLHEDERGEKTMKRRKQSRASKTKMDCLLNSNPSQNSHKVRSRMPSAASKEVKQVTAVEYELNSSTIAVKGRKKNPSNLQRNLARRRLHPEDLAQNPTPGDLQKR